jgi:hypothetical protein
MLLLDLDGVVVLELEPPLVTAPELILLHQDIGKDLDALGLPVVILTHRSRREAEQIIRAARLAPRRLAGVLAAEDLFLAGLRKTPVQMLKRGLRKDLILSLLEHRFGVERSRTAFIDDRLDNLRDLLAAGLGLAIHAPSIITGESVVTFDFAEAVAAVRDWDQRVPRQDIISLAPRQLAAPLWQRTGLNTASHRLHAFNAARRVGRIVRQAFAGRPT